MAKCLPQGKFKSCLAVGSEARLSCQWSPVFGFRAAPLKADTDGLRTFQGGFTLLGACISQVDVVLGQR